MRRSVAFLALLVLAAACDRREPPDPRAMLHKALFGVLVYPLSSEVSVAAGADAAQVTMSTRDSLAKVAGWFRQSLIANGWTLQSDVTSGDSIAIVAMLGKRPLWLTLRSNVGAPGTTYTIIGAVTDSTADSTPH
jgi:hypothetical protein